MGGAGLWLSFLAILAFGLGVAVPTFAGLLRVWGRMVPQPYIQADYLFGLVWAVALGVSLLFWPVPQRDKIPLLVLWAAKSFVTLGFMLLYEWNYSLDAYGYFAISTLPQAPFEAVGWGAGTANVGALSWIHNYVLPDSYHALKVSFAMLGLVAIYLFYRGGVMFLGREEPRLLYLLGLFPSILFWSSILGKDPVQLLGIALYAYGAIGWGRTGRWGYLPLLSAGVLLAMWIRVWSVPILMAPLAVLMFLGVRKGPARLLVLGGGLVVFGAGVAELSDQFAIEGIQDLLSTAQGLGTGWEGGSGQTRAVQFTSLTSLVAFAPVGAFTALFRPLPGEVMNPFGLLAGLENLVLLFLLGLAVVRARLATFSDPLVVWGVLLVATWASVYGFVSYYNMGAAVRFKLQILPVLLGLLLFLSKKPEIRSQARIDADGHNAE